MDRDLVLEVQASFSDLYNACSPPSHSDMDIAFARAKVESPRDSDAKWGVNKRDRVRVAFEDALNHGDERVNRLIDEMVRTLRQARVFSFTSEDVDVFTRELRDALRALGRIMDEEGRLQPATESPVIVGGTSSGPRAQSRSRTGPASAPQNDLRPAENLPRTDPSSVPQSGRIFLVHGHDTLRAVTLQRDVRMITGVDPIILADEASGGDTVIEKFERYASESGYAIVLMTADDEMAHPADEEKPMMRARQNVILELGYFIGRLGRRRVLVLREDVEWPSDIAGVVYTDLKASNWMEIVRRELRGAGFQILA